MDSLIKDLRYGARTLLKNPAFTLAAIVTLALGIGANTAIFTVVDAAMLRGLPYQSPDNLYHLWEVTPQKEFPKREFSYPDYQDYQQIQAFDGLAAYTGGSGILSGRGEPERIFAPSASANFFSVLGVNPIIGRSFQTGEDTPGTERVTVLTYGFWQSKFGGDPGIIGQPLTINGNNYTVVGVLPASFQFALRPNDLWLPYQPSEVQLTRRFLHGTNLIARLRSNVSVEQAQSEMSAIASRIEQEHSQSHAGTGTRIVPLHEEVVGQIRPILMLLLGAVGFVLLIACANVASLLLTRALARQKEVALRAALGASRWRVVRQLLTESLMLSLVGGAAGLLVAYWGLDAIVAALPDNQINALPFLKSLQIDTGVLAFVFGLSLLTGIVFGLAPALQSTRFDLHAVLKEGGRTTSGIRQRLRSSFVVLQIALAVVLLIGAGLMLKSLQRLMEVNIGFDSQNLLTMTVALPPSKYPETPQRVIFHDQLKERIEALPGVAGAGTVNIVPLQAGNTTRFNIEGDPIPPPGQETEANLRTANDSYFQALGIPLLSGRFFDARDREEATGVVIINKTLADRVFAGRDPIGRRLIYSGTQFEPDEIIGVVGDVKITGLADPVRPVVYYPYRQNPGLLTNLVVRTNSDPTSLIAAIRNESRGLEPDVAIFNVSTMDQMITNSPASFMRRFPAMLIGVFAVVAILLAAIGIYGVVSYSVSQQTHYIGVRMALGAQAGDILKMVLKQGLVLAFIGLGIGVVLALFLTRLLGGLLFEVSASDPATFGVVVGILGFVALLACWIPARRATKVDPLVALRYE